MSCKTLQQSATNVSNIYCRLLTVVGGLLDYVQQPVNKPVEFGLGVSHNNSQHSANNLQQTLPLRWLVSNTGNNLQQPSNNLQQPLNNIQLKFWQIK